MADRELPPDDLEGEGELAATKQPPRDLLDDFLDEPLTQEEATPAESSAAAKAPASTIDDEDLFGPATTTTITAAAAKPETKKEPEPAAPAPSLLSPLSPSPTTTAPAAVPEPAKPAVAAAPVEQPKPKPAPASELVSSFGDEPVKPKAPPASIAVPSGAASAAAAAAAAATPASPPRRAVVLQQSGDFTLTVTDPERIGDGMGAYVVYKITAKTTLPAYKQQSMTCKRRFNDFFTLQRYLVSKYPGIIIAPCPPKDAVGTGFMKLKTSSGDEFITRRQGALERFMRRIVGHPTLAEDEAVQIFLQTDQKMPKPKSDKSAFGAIVSKIDKFVGFVDPDEFFEQKARDVDAVELQLKKLVAALDRIVEYRQDMAIATTKFAELFAALAEAEENASLKTAMQKLADVEAKVAKLQEKQAVRDFDYFSEVMSDYIGLLGAVRVVFSQRQDAFRAWSDAQSTLQKKRENETKLKAAGKADKLSQAAFEVAEAEKEVERSRKAFDDISATIRTELDRFDIVKVKDFQVVAIQYVEALMTMQHQIMAAWEAFLPEAKAIAAQ